MEPRKATFRDRMLDWELMFGLSCHSGVELLEIAAARGADFAWVDMEHAPLSTREVHDAVRAADAHDLPLLVRVPDADAKVIASVLDGGAIGVLVAHVQTAAQARAVVNSVKYAPDGDRSMCPQVRACDYVGWAGWDAYWRDANRQTVVGVIVEDPVGLENLEAICDEPGVDLVWLGAGDLAQSLGLGASFTHDAVIEARCRTLALCKEVGKAAYCQLPVIGSAEAFDFWHNKGGRFFTWPDVSVFAEFFSALLNGARERLRSPV